MTITINLDTVIDNFTPFELDVLKEITTRRPRKNSIINFSVICDNLHISKSVPVKVIRKLELIGVIKTVGCGKVGTKIIEVNHEALKYLGGLIDD